MLKCVPVVVCHSRFGSFIFYQSLLLRVSVWNRIFSITNICIVHANLCLACRMWFCSIFFEMGKQVISVHLTPKTQQQLQPAILDNSRGSFVFYLVLLVVTECEMIKFMNCVASVCVCNSIDHTQNNIPHRRTNLLPLRINFPTNWRNFQLITDYSLNF